MDKNPDKSAPTARPRCFVVEAIPALPGQRPRMKTMARLEREAAGRKWLLICLAVAAALVAGVLIGRFFLP